MQPKEVSNEPGMLEALPRDMRAANAGASLQTSAYVVQSGDTYEAVAQKLGITVAQLLGRNPSLDANQLNAGETLQIPQALSPADLETMAARDTDGEAEALSVSSLGMTPAQPRPQAEPELVSIWACPADHVWIVLPSGWDVVNVLRYYNVSYQALAESNPQIDLESMESGQNLCIPPGGSRGMCGGGDLRCYVLGDDDTLDTLSAASGFSVWEILRMNPCMAPNDFVAGCVVCLPQN